MIRYIVVPRSGDTAAEDVVFNVRFVAEFAANVIVKCGGVRRTDGIHRRVAASVRTTSVAVDTFEATVEASSRTPFAAEKFFIEFAELDAEIIVFDKIFIESGKVAELCRERTTFCRRQ